MHKDQASFSAKLLKITTGSHAISAMTREGGYDRLVVLYIEVIFIIG